MGENDGGTYFIQLKNKLKFTESITNLTNFLIMKTCNKMNMKLQLPSHYLKFDPQKTQSIKTHLPNNENRKTTSKLTSQSNE